MPVQQKSLETYWMPHVIIVIFWISMNIHTNSIIEHLTYTHSEPKSYGQIEKGSKIWNIVTLIEMYKQNIYI